MKKIELIIINNLIKREGFLRKVLPFLKDEYFFDKTDKFLFNEINNFAQKYNKTPSLDSLLITLQSKNNITEDEYEKIDNYLTELKELEPEKNEDWLIEKTEKFCQEKAIYNAISQSISILDNTDKTKDKGIIPEILSNALAVTFDNSVGHDYIDDYEERYDFYHRKEKKIRFDLEYFNKITRGGLSTKTLNIILAGTGVGKSLAMCHFATSFISQGKNVLYITLEMSEEKIAQRIDANLLDIDINEMNELSKDVYFKKLENIKQKTVGKLIIKEYPTAMASTTHFRNLINELKLKKNFVADIIIVDYLNICASSRVKPGATVNSYTYIKSIAEELRGLAIESDVPLISATQTNRTGFSNSDVGLEDTSESFGLPATADLMFALITSEELAASNQIMVKQLKNRYSDPEHYKRFVVGVEKTKMRLYDVDEESQDDIIDFGILPKKETDRSNKFAGFKV